MHTLIFFVCGFVILTHQLNLCSSQTIFGSLIRNNLNRYLKNPLFTKSFVRNSGWPSDEHGGGEPMILSPQNGQISEFITSQNQFANDHVLQPSLGSNYNFDMLSLHNEFAGLLTPPPSANNGNGNGKPFSASSQNHQQQQPPPSPHHHHHNHHHNQQSQQASSPPTSSKRINHKMPSASSPSATIAIVAITSADSASRIPPSNGTKGNFFDDEKRNIRVNSKSLTVSKGTNAYSDSSKIKRFNSKSNNSKNLYVDNGNVVEDSLIRSHRQLQQPHSSLSSPHRSNIEATTGGKNRNFESVLHNGGNKYNQEKALNLKLEYGFRPLPTGSKSSHGDDEDGNFLKDFTVGDSIQLNDPFEPQSESINHKSSATNDLASSLTAAKENGESGNNIYSLTANIDAVEDAANRAQKSMSLENTIQSNLNNHLEEFAHDYKKYISYPMETESSDIHKLAFRGVESFKPDIVDGHMSVDHRRSVDSLANYPDIKHFKSQGIDCARNSGYCEFDSNYPKEFVSSVIGNCSDRIDDMYIEMPENLADFSDYKSFIQVGRVDSRYTSNTSLCDSERKYIRPSAIQDINGDFYLILQSSFYFQQVPVEICNKPGSTCNMVGRCNSQVKCTQKYRTYMLISIDSGSSSRSDAQHHHAHRLPPYHDTQSSDAGKAVSCPKMRMYRLPSACVCELTRI